MADERLIVNLLRRRVLAAVGSAPIVHQLHGNLCRADAPDAGVNDSVPLAVIAGCTANKDGLSGDTRNDRLWPDSSLGPADMAVAQPATETSPTEESTFWSAPLRNEGASFTGVTVMVNVSPPKCRRLRWQCRRCPAN